MKRNMLNRVLSLVLVLSMVMSFAVMPVGATEGEGGEPHVHTWVSGTCSDTACNATCNHEGTEKTENVTASTCAAAGTKTVTCVCGVVISTETLALAEHSYDEATGTCTGCGAQKPTEPQGEEQPAQCSKNAECTATENHDAQCPKHPDYVAPVACDKSAECRATENHDAQCPKHPDYVAPATCDKTAECKATENHDAECLKAKADAEASAQRVADVQKLIDALPEKYFAHEAEAVAAQYEACTAAIGALSDAERGELDMTKYYATATMELAPVTDAATFNAALAAAANDAAVTIELAGNVTLDVGAHDHYALGTAANQTITIDGKGQYTLTFHNTNGDWNHIATNGAALVLKNMRITNTGHNDGPWNRHDINFACNVQLNNVTSDKALAFKAGATLNTVTVSDTGDIYAIWVQPNGQTVSINGLTVTCGRGIKIDSQYASAPALVKLSVSNATFTTSAKSAILVNSAAGANVTLSNVNISAVAADAVNPVWVDDGSAAYYGKVTVTGGTKALEGGTDGYKVVVTSGTEPVAYCDDLKTAFANAVDNATITLMEHVTSTETIEVTKPVTLNLNGKTITNSLASGRMFAVKANMTIDGTASGSAVTGTTATSFGLANLYSANFTINGGRYAFNMDYGAMIKAQEGTCNLTLNNVTMETDDKITDLTSATGRFGNVSISGSTLTSREGNGVILCSTGTVTMSDTKVSAAGDTAVEISTAKNSTVTNCTLTSGSGNPNWALWVSFGAEVTVKGGSYTGVGVAPSGGTLTIESGTVTANNVSAWAYSGKTATVNITGGTFNTAPTKGGQGGTEIINITGGTFTNAAGMIDVSAFVPVTHAQNTEGKVEPKANTNVPNAAGATKVDTSTVKNDANVDVASMGTNEAAKTTSGLDTALSQTAVNNLVKDMDTNGADKVVLNMQIDVKETQTDGTTQNVKISYDVTPVLQPVKVEETNGTTTTENVGTPKELTTVEQPITFRLPLPANTTSKFVNVWHKGVALGAFEVKGTSPNQYIELQSKTFSPWTVELLPSTVTALNVESGSTKFATVADALAAAGSNSVIKLLADVAENININKDITLNLNGKTINGYIFAPSATLTIENGSIVNTNSDYSAVEVNAGSLVLNNVNISSARHAVRIDGPVTATINGGTYRTTGTAGLTTHAVNVSGAAKVTIQSGAFIGPKGTASDSGSAVNVQAGAEVTINGGSFSDGFNDTLAAGGKLVTIGGTYDQDPTKYCKPRFAGRKNGDTYSIVPAVASVTEGNNTFYYGTAAQALAAVESGKSITILNAKDAKYDISVVKSEGMTITDDGKGNVTIKVEKAVSDNQKYGVVKAGEVTYLVDTIVGTVTIDANGIVAGDNVPVDKNNKPVYRLIPIKSLGTYVQSSTGTLTFESNMIFDTFSKAFVDGSEIKLNTDYVASRGSTIIELSNAYLRKLAVGKHTLTLLDVYGNSVPCDFHVSPNYYADASNPKTGDDIFAPAALMLFSVSALAVLMLNKKRIF